MPDLERALRDLLTDDRLTVPVVPGAVDAVHRGVRRRRHRRNAATAGSAALTVVAVAALAVGLTGAPAARRTPAGIDRHPSPSAAPAPRSADTVAFNPLPYDPAALADYPGTVPAKGVAWCTADHLSLSATQTAAGGVVVAARNDGTAPCGLQGSPTITGTDRAGDQVLAAAPADPFLLLPWFALRPGQTAWSTFGIAATTGECAVPITRLQLSTGHGAAAAVTTPAGGLFATSGAAKHCAAAPPTFGVVGDAHWTRPNGRPRLAQGVSVSARPTALRAMQGTTVHFQVALRGATTAVNPCLGFREQLTDTATGKTVATSVYQLDCNAIHLLGVPNVTLDMQFAVPYHATVGSASLSWQLSSGQSVGALPVRITPAPPQCRLTQLSVTAGRYAQTMDQFGQVIVLRNVSARACSLYGHPGFTVVDAAGRPHAWAPHWARGFLFSDPGPSTVVLAAHGGVASFTFGGAASGPGGSACPKTSAVRFYPPNFTTQVDVPVRVPDCGRVTVAAVVPGSVGTPP